MCIRDRCETSDEQEVSALTSFVDKIGLGCFETLNQSLVDVSGTQILTDINPQQLTTPEALIEISTSFQEQYQALLQTFLIAPNPEELSKLYNAYTFFYATWQARVVDLVATTAYKASLSETFIPFL